jgi:hypothetical protein
LSKLNDEKLLSRQDFKKLTFLRDNNKCVFCDEPAVDAHHILDRKLWTDGGYYLSNAASVCADHHWDCEKTNLTVEEVRTACLIDKFSLPGSLSYDLIYDKWGNIILDNGMIQKGELFLDDGVQKILKTSGNFWKYID